MRNLRQALILAVVLTAAWTIGAPANKPAPANATHYETATVAGGCFWGLQQTLRRIPGVIKTTAGYTGGTTLNPTYELVAGRKTGHVEAVEVTFDPAKLSYETLLADFLIARNPVNTAVNTNASRTSVIFYHGPAQQLAAQRTKDKINHSGKWETPVTVEIKAATKFYAAEEYHQDYYRKSAATHTCDLGKN